MIFFPLVVFVILYEVDNELQRCVFFAGFTISGVCINNKNNNNNNDLGANIDVLGNAAHVQSTATKVWSESTTSWGREK